METKSVFDPNPAAAKREWSPALTGLLLMLVMVMAAAGFFGWRSVKVERENQRLNHEVDGLMAELEQQDQQAKRRESEMASIRQEADRLQSELVKMRTQWAEQQKEWERREEENRKRLQRSFDALASVVNDSGSALDYLREMEAKVRKGQVLNQDELDELKVIGKGLGVLQAQYERPLEEFRDLEESIRKELEDSSASAPSEERKFLRNILDWRYRERQKAEKESLLKEQGRREALEDTQQELAQRYANAQQEMAAIRKQFGEHLQKLDEVVGSEMASATEMASFFEVSAEVIKIHQRAMNIQVEPVPPPVPLMPPGPDVTGIKP